MFVGVGKPIKQLDEFWARAVTHDSFRGAQFRQREHLIASRAFYHRGTKIMELGRVIHVGLRVHLSRRQNRASPLLNILGVMLVPRHARVVGPG